MAIQNLGMQQKCGGCCGSGFSSVLFSKRNGFSEEAVLKEVQLAMLQFSD